MNLDGTDKTIVVNGVVGNAGGAAQTTMMTSTQEYSYQSYNAQQNLQASGAVSVIQRLGSLLLVVSNSVGNSIEILSKIRVAFITACIYWRVALSCI